MTLKDISLGTYQHYKNKKLYKIIGTARHSETYEEMVVYQALYCSEKFGDYQIWVRPKKMFFEDILHEGCHVPRFKRIESR